MILQNKRSCLRKIVEEKMGMTFAHMVLVIVQMQLINNKWIIEISDGWHSFYWIVSQNLGQESNNDKFFLSNNDSILRLINEGKLFPGQKLHIGSMTDFPLKNGIAIPNADFAENETKRVTVEFNSLSRAKWHEKLGLRHSFLIKNLKSLRPNGGHISFIDVLVLKKYNMLSSKNHGPFRLFLAFIFSFKHFIIFASVC